MLDFYRQHLSTVEVNNTFYQLPSDDKLAAWSDTVPQDFLFAVKASRYITHMKKLKDGKDSSQNFFARIDSLGTRLGPVGRLCLWAARPNPAAALTRRALMAAWAARRAWAQRGRTAHDPSEA